MSAEGEYVFGETGIWRPARRERWMDMFDAIRLREPDSSPYGETYLRLAAVDLADDAAIREFVATWGPLGLRWQQHPVHAERVEVPDYAHILGFRGTSDSTVGRNLADALEGCEAELDRHFPPGNPDATSARPRVEETYEEFRVGASLVLSTFRAWRTYRERPNHGFVPFIWGEPAPDTGEDGWLPELAGEEFDDLISPLLAPFHPTVLRHYPEAPGAGAAPFLANVSLINVMALEIYNHAVENADFKSCANETCGRTFVRQSGGAQHGQYRTRGVKFCTPECARAQAQRDYRRRESAKRRRDNRGRS